MRFKFQTLRHGRCLAETEQEGSHFETVIRFDQNTSPKSVHYVLHVRDEPLPKQIPEGGALQDATLIAINHFQSVKTKDGDEFEFHCSRITPRWSGVIYNMMGG